MGRLDVIVIQSTRKQRTFKFFQIWFHKKDTWGITVEWNKSPIKGKQLINEPFVCLKSFREIKMWMANLQSKFR